MFGGLSSESIFRKFVWMAVFLKKNIEKFYGKAHIFEKNIKTMSSNTENHYY